MARETVSCNVIQDGLRFTMWPRLAGNYSNQLRKLRMLPYINVAQSTDKRMGGSGIFAIGQTDFFRPPSLVVTTKKMFRYKHLFLSSLGVLSDSSGKHNLPGTCSLKL